MATIKYAFVVTGESVNDILLKPSPWTKNQVVIEQEGDEITIPLNRITEVIECLESLRDQ